MIIKVLKWGRRYNNKILRFHLNYYRELIKSLKISEAEMNKYKFELDGDVEFKV